MKIISNEEIEQIKQSDVYAKDSSKVIEKLIESVENLKDLLKREARYRRGYASNK